MATRHKLTIETLTELGARKLAELLLAEAAGNRQLKQTLNLAISAKEGYPPPQKLPIAPIFIADSISLAVSREKDGKLRIVYAGWPSKRGAISSARRISNGMISRPTARAGSDRSMTHGDSPDHRREQRNWP